MRKKDIDNINYKKLVNYGFTLKDKNYSYEKNILNDKFKVVIEVNDTNLASMVIDNKTNLEYVLVDVDNAYGNYVGSVRIEYESLVNDVISKCFDNKKYHSKQMNDILKYIKNNYHDSVEYLWKNDVLDGAVRNKNNKKWYVLVMVINSSKLGFDGKDELEIINVRYQKDHTNEVVNNINIFPAWHMNKKSWITIVLNGSLDNEIVYSLIDNSYNLTIKKA